MELVIESQRAQATVAHYGVETLLREMTPLLHERSAKTRVCSLSKRCNNMSMWAKYADSHTGYCLEFLNAGMFQLAMEVEYGNVVELDVSSPDAAHDAFGLFFRKSTDWSNEEEVRIVAPTIAEPRVAFDPALLTRIILGKDITVPCQQRIRQLAASRTPALTVVQSRFDEYEQKLTLNP